MKNIFLLLLSVIFYSCNYNQLVSNYKEKEITINSNDAIMIYTHKSATFLEIQNLSDQKISLNSSLKVPEFILPKSLFTYTIPKKGKVYIINNNINSIIFNLKVESKSPVIIQPIANYGQK